MNVHRQLRFAAVVACFGALAVAAWAGDAQVSVWLASAVDGKAIIGEPLRIGVEIAPPEGSTGPVAIAASGDDWRNDVVVELAVEGGGSSVATRAHGAHGERNVTATAEAPVEGLWWIPAAQTASLPPGRYVLQARWPGATLPAEEFRFELAPPSEVKDPNLTVLAMAFDDVLGDHPEAAARRVDAVLARDASNVDLLTFRALLCLGVGDLMSARACLSRAQLLGHRVADAEPSIGVAELRRQLGSPPPNAPLSVADVPAVVPDWSRPPDSVFTDIDAPTAAAVASAAATTASSNAPATPATTTPVAPNLNPTYVSTDAGAVVPVTELAEPGILADVHGQWATAATASSQYSAPNYAAAQMTGAPNVDAGGDSVTAWCPGSSAHETQWIELTYARPVHATEVRVRQSYNPGAVVKVEAFDADGGVHLWWSGVDPARPPGALNAIAWFAVRVPKTDYLVAKIRLTLDIETVASWQEIDAVQLVGE